ncbi:MAG: ribose-phosphate pyrophosphokinase [Thermomicrobiales bacterium]|nr:ribose-phosphate pyrophosphokinase [Thermomicrobiales bacterium]
MTHLVLLDGSANEPLAQKIANTLGLPLLQRELQVFPDGEIRATILESVRGADVFVIQPTGPPVERNLIMLLLLTDACRRAGAGRITAVIPYFGYARQDRRTHGREAVGARLVADLLRTSGIDRVVAIDLHNAALESAFGMPLEHLSAVPILAEAVRTATPPDGVIVAPDVGAAKLADRYAAHLQLPVAIVHKTRVSGEIVHALRISGDVCGRTPIVVDDMISTGGTVVAAVNAVMEAGATGPPIVLATHALLVGPAVDALRSLSLQRLIATDTLAAIPRDRLPVHVASVAPMVAEAIARLHDDRSLSDLLAT